MTAQLTGTSCVLPAVVSERRKRGVVIGYGHHAVFHNPRCGQVTGNRFVRQAEPWNPMAQCCLMRWVEDEAMTSVVTA